MYSNINKDITPKWFVALVILLAIWNLLGIGAFVMQVSMTPDKIASLPISEQALYQNIPSWANLAFACAVIGGTLGCILLALKRAISIPILAISLFGVLTQMSHSLFMTNAYEVYGPGGMVMPTLILLVAIFLLYLSLKAKQKKWIK
ncbi:hypothetical protein [Paraglaciecola sp.]|uniref:hypothetical protein n=1 Tax=Paraglaciecola sp. TaxID=1920173 RepID=UPI0032633694